MDKANSIDIRLIRISKLLENFSKGDFSAREDFEKKGDELDHIIKMLNQLGEKVQNSGQVIHDYEKRVTAIMNVLLKYTMFDFSEKAVISHNGDEIDAISLALNTLGEELNDRILAEKKHTQELEKLAIVIATTADAVISFRTDGLITQWNKSAERIYGYSAEEMVEKSKIMDFTPDEDKEALRAALLKVNSGEQIIDTHARRKRKDGKIIDVSITMTPIYNEEGKVDAISGVSRDITEQKQAELVLRESETRYRTLVEGVKDYAIITLDTEGNFTSWNEGAERIKGFTAEEILGKHFSICYTEEDKKNHLPEKYLEEAINEDKSYHEGYSVRKDGSLFWGSVLITSLKNEDGNLIGFSKITRDLSAYKMKDEEIRETNQRLEQKNIELERINKELASFAYVSSHDLQEPLRKIQTFASRVIETDMDRLSEQGLNYFERMRSAANRMQQLLQDILNYSRISKPDLQKEDVDLSKLITEVKEDLHETIYEKNAVVEIGEMCKVPVIPFQFKQLMLNLMSNGLKFSAPGRPPRVKIKSKIEKDKKTIVRLHLNSNKYCHITVSDNGIGFEPHFKEQIFEVFQRLHGQETYPGTGIGLAICKKILDNHGGAIEADSKLNEGATFHVYFPVK